MHSDITRQQVTKHDNNKNKNNSVTKTGKRSNSAAFLIIHALVHAGKKVNGIETENHP